MSTDKIKRPDIVHNLDLLKMLVRKAGVEWVVIHTNPKCEWRAHDGLVARGILAYLPVECIERTYGANTKKKRGQTYIVKRPMFSRYLFAGIDLAQGESVDDVRACDGVEGLVSLSKNSCPVRVSKEDLVRVMEVSHGTFEGEVVPDGWMAAIADLPEGSKLKLVKGAWRGMDFTLTGYDEARRRVMGFKEGRSVTMQVDVGVDEIDLGALPHKKDSPDPSGTGESIHHTNGATEAA